MVTAKIIDFIINRQLSSIFISPHLDDAILSSGSLIYYLSQRGVRAKVINVFTKASSKPYTRFADSLMRSSHCDDATDYFYKRKIEDRSVFDHLKIKTSNLDFTDAAWRKRNKNNLIQRLIVKFYPGSLHLYPTGNKIDKGRILAEDALMIKKINEQISQKITDKKNTLIFCPLAIGKHVDHIITREVCLKNFPRIIFWSDFPYNLNQKQDLGFIKKYKLTPFTFNKYLSQKRQLILEYRSQIPSLFPGGKIQLLPEKYYINLVRLGF